MGQNFVDLRAVAKSSTAENVGSQNSLAIIKHQRLAVVEAFVLSRRDLIAWLESSLSELKGLPDQSWPFVLAHARQIIGAENFGTPSLTELARLAAGSLKILSINDHGGSCRPLFVMVSLTNALDAEPAVREVTRKIWTQGVKNGAISSPENDYLCEVMADVREFYRSYPAPFETNYLADLLFSSGAIAVRLRALAATILIDAKMPPEYRHPLTSVVDCLFSVETRATFADDDAQFILSTFTSDHDISFWAQNFRRLEETEDRPLDGESREARRQFLTEGFASESPHILIYECQSDDATRICYARQYLAAMTEDITVEETFISAGEILEDQYHAYIDIIGSGFFESIIDIGRKKTIDWIRTNARRDNVYDFRRLKEIRRGEPSDD